MFIPSEGEHFRCDCGVVQASERLMSGCVEIRCTFHVWKFITDMWPTGGGAGRCWHFPVGEWKFDHMERCLLHSKWLWSQVIKVLEGLWECLKLSTSGINMTSWYGRSQTWGYRCIVTGVTRYGDTRGYQGWYSLLGYCGTRFRAMLRSRHSNYTESNCIGHIYE